MIPRSSERPCRRFCASSATPSTKSPTARAAIAHVKQRRVDLVLLDLRMSDGDGFTVLSYLQEHHAALPVLGAVGHERERDPAEDEQAVQARAPPLLIKPVDPNQLAQLVALQLSGELPRVDTFRANS